MSRRLGNTGEDAACSFLLKKNYSIVDRNFHSRFGEVDIIALKGKKIVFVEVKTRTSTSFGAPAEFITPHKLEKIIATAYYYLQVNNLKNSFQIDAIEILMNGGGIASINHIENITL